MKTVAQSLIVIVLALFSLLTYPAHIHWMVLAALFAAIRGKSCWPWLAAVVLIVLVKQPGYTFAFLILVATILIVAVHDLYLVKRTVALENYRSFNRIASYAVFLLLATGNFGLSRWLDSNCWPHLVASTQPVVCLGDSLTAFGYPKELERLISLQVVDFGRDGITADDGIKLIPEILAVKPQAVVIELGGHDYNAKNKTRSKTKQSLEELINAFVDQKISVIVVEIPRGFITDPYRGLERELTAKYDLQLIDDSVIRNFVYFSPVVPPGMWLDESSRLSEDGLHPNDRGNRYFAKEVGEALVRLFGDEIRR